MSNNSSEAKCPECGNKSWRDGEVSCEDCGGHSAVICKECGFSADHVWNEKIYEQVCNSYGVKNSWEIND